MSTKRATTTKRTRGAKAAPAAATPAGEAVFYFPAYGCDPVRPMTEAQARAEQRVLETSLRAHWTHPGVKAIITLLERRAARSKSAAVRPGAGVHEQGQAFALEQLVGNLQQLGAGLG